MLATGSRIQIKIHRGQWIATNYRLTLTLKPYLRNALDIIMRRLLGNLNESFRGKIIE